MMNYPSSRILLLAAGLAAAGAANGTMLVYSGFEGYPASGDVAGTVAPATGDIGIDVDTWAGQNWSWQGTGLSYTSVDGTIDGGNRALDYTGSNYQFRQVNVSTTAPIADLTVYIRFVAALDAAPTGSRVSGVQFVINNDVSNNNNNFMPGFGILAGGDSVTNGSNTNQFFAATNSTGLTGTPSLQFGGTINTGANLLVARMNWGGSTYTSLDVWANPLYTDHGSPDATLDISSLNIASITDVVLRGGATGGGPRPTVDELVIATAWDDVVIPEPSTYALLGGLAALGLVILRRRRA